MLSFGWREGWRRHLPKQHFHGFFDLIGVSIEIVSQSRGVHLAGILEFRCAFDISHIAGNVTIHKPLLLPLVNGEPPFSIVGDVLGGANARSYAYHATN